MRRAVTAFGMTGLMLLMAVPASAAPNDSQIPSVVVDDQVQGAEHACNGLGRMGGPHRAAQTWRHGCAVPGPVPPPLPDYQNA